MKKALYGWTDYPFIELGEADGEAAPVRAVKAIAYDGNKYCKVEVCGVLSEIKAGYLYRRKGRCGNVPTFAYSALRAIERQS